MAAAETHDLAGHSALVAPDDAAMVADREVAQNAPDLEHESDDSGHSPIDLNIGLATDLIDDVVNQNRQPKRPADCPGRPSRRPSHSRVWKASL